MNKNNTSLVPKIRFPEFSVSWAKCLKNTPKRSMKSFLR